MSVQDISDDEISLLDIYEFLKEGWVTLLATTVLVGATGAGVSFTLPEIYLAEAKIQPSQVTKIFFNNNNNNNYIEGVNILAEKMQNPNYYSSQTLTICQYKNNLNSQFDREGFVKNLKPRVEKNSNFVSISYRSDSPAKSIACLDAVLSDVKAEHNKLILPFLQEIRSTLKEDQDRLKIAEELFTQLSRRAVSFDFKDNTFSASQLLLATFLSKQTEIAELKKSISRAEVLLAEPITRPSSFATPPYSSGLKVEPKRLQIITISLLAGGFLGLLLLLLKNALKKIKSQSAPLASPPTN